MPDPRTRSPFSIRNVRLFIAFRIFFNARFYYPVFTILFLDFGLTLEQFALLNAAWAASIVLLEVPSGALADTIGRRNLLVATGVLMVAEMALLCFAPKGHPTLLFVFFLINRIFSGAAEAAASGADEALAYDSLAREGNIEDWDTVLERQMRYQAAAFIIAMSLGAAVYDPALMQTVADGLGLGLDRPLTQADTLRFPLYLTLGMALMTLVTTWRMREVPTDDTDTCPEPGQCVATFREAFQITLTAGKWILRTPFALVLILAGLLFDHIIRMLLTLNSQYFRMITLPEATFGLIGSGMAVLGLFIPRLAKLLAERFTPRFNFGLLILLTFAGLLGMTFFWPIWGLVPMLVLYSVMLLSTFFLSRYLNRITDSRQRATVLSFKGLSYNLAYGIIGVLYSILLTGLRWRVTDVHPDLADPALENRVFMISIEWFPWYFLVTAAVLLIFAGRNLRFYPGIQTGRVESKIFGTSLRPQKDKHITASSQFESFEKIGACSSDRRGLGEQPPSLPDCRGTDAICGGGYGKMTR